MATARTSGAEGAAFLVVVRSCLGAVAARPRPPAQGHADQAGPYVCRSPDGTTTSGARSRRARKDFGRPSLENKPAPAATSARRGRQSPARLNARDGHGRTRRSPSCIRKPTTGQGLRAGPRRRRAERDVMNRRSRGQRHHRRALVHAYAKSHLGNSHGLERQRHVDPSRRADSRPDRDFMSTSVRGSTRRADLVGGTMDVMSTQCMALPRSSRQVLELAARAASASGAARRATIAERPCPGIRGELVFGLPTRRPHMKIVAACSKKARRWTRRR